MNQTEFLKGISLFSGLSDEVLSRINEKTESIQFVRDALICKEGQKADSMFVIKSGIVQIFCDDGKGGRKILTHLKLGEYFGEMALLTEEPRTASACALAETDVIKIKKDDFQTLLKTAPEISLNIIKTLCDRLSKANVGTSTEKSFNVFAVMGPDTSSGKSLFARNLAYAMHKILGKDILLYDPNLRDDRVAKNLGIDQHSKIIDELVDKERILDIKKYVVRAPCGLLTILPQENGFTDLRLKEFHTFSIMKTVMETFEFIVVDSSSMFTKVTKEIVQSCDKIIYLISSKNISIGGLIDHFEETRRTWKVDPNKVVYGVNHITDDPDKESIIQEKDKNFIRFELPYDKKMSGNREPDKNVIIQRDPDHRISKLVNKQAEEVLFDQKFGILLPAFEPNSPKGELSKRWAESGCQELANTLRSVEIKGPVDRNGVSYYIIEGRAAKWTLNNQVVAVIDFANKFKQEFGLAKISFTLNDHESII